MLQDLYTYKAKIIKVYDGDTCTAEVDLGFHIKRTMVLRLTGIDTPELRLEERERGLEVARIVKDLILDKEVIIKTEKDTTGKYGRTLATIYLIGGLLSGVNLNEYLVENGYAQRYLS